MLWSPLIIGVTCEACCLYRVKEKPQTCRYTDRNTIFIERNGFRMLSQGCERLYKWKEGIILIISNPGIGPAPMSGSTPVYSGRSELAHPQASRIGSDLIGKAGNQPEPRKGLTDSQEKRRLLRQLQAEQQERQRAQEGGEKKTFTAVSQNTVEDFLRSYGVEEEEDDELQAEFHYNYKDVANKIRSAKTSAGASRAVVAAKRKVQELKRKIASKAGDPKDLQLALSHAKKMEMAARKKKHHLELEELVEHTGKRDDEKEKQEERISDMQSEMTRAAQDRISEAEDRILDEREKLFDEAGEELQEELQEAAQENAQEAAEDMLGNLNELLSELGEEELKQLEEAMEAMETMEIVDPHMSEEDLAELKRKHRNAEEKVLVKAEMDYLKSYLKYHMDKNGAVFGGGNGGGAGRGIGAGSVPSADIGSSAAFDVSVGEVSFDVEAGSTVDVQL